MTTGLAAVDVSYRYDDGHLALDAVSLTVAPGDRIALVGPSGSGKTTLATMLLALDRPTAGTVTLDDRPVRPGAGRRLDWFRSEVQYIPQDPGSSLDPRKSALEQVVRPLRWLRAPGDHRDRARDALLSVGLGVELFAARPNELSGGQKQRVAVARALVCRPRFLVADEPVSGLDADTADLVLTMVTAHCDRFSTALLMVTHDLTVAASAATTLAVMDDGRVVESGSTAAVLGDPRHHRTRALLDAIPRPVGL